MRSISSTSTLLLGPLCFSTGVWSRIRAHFSGSALAALMCVVFQAAMPPALLAQGSGEIAGQVFSPEGESLPLATVQLFAADGSRQAQAADAQGRFAFSGLAPGRYRLVSSYVGYPPDTLLVDAAADQVRQVNVQLRPSGGMGPVILISGTRIIESGGGELVQHISGEELKQMGDRDPIAGIAKRSARVYDRDGDGGTLHVAGSRSDAVAYYVDGVRMIGSLNVPMAAVADVTLYAGGIPARYGDATGGVIVIRTKSYLAFLD